MRFALVYSMMVVILFIAQTSAFNCTDAPSGYYCTLYDDDGTYVYDVIKPQTIISSHLVPELDGRNIFIYSEATYYHNGHTGLEFASLTISGSGHFFVDGHSSVTIDGTLTVESGASLSIGTDSTVHIEGSIVVFPGAILFGVVNTQRPMMTFVDGSPDFTHFAVRQNSVTEAPEIFFQRKLCETPAFAIEEGRSASSIHKLFVCRGEEDIDDSVVIYNGVLLTLAAEAPPVFIPVPVSVPVPIPNTNSTPPHPLPQSHTPVFPNQTKDDFYTVGGIDVDPSRIWPYCVLILFLIVSIAVYIIVAILCRKRIRTKAENVKILMSGGEDSYADEFELTSMSDGFVDLVPTFDTNSSSVSGSDNGETSILSELMDETDRLKSERFSKSGTSTPV